MVCIVGSFLPPVSCFYSLILMYSVSFCVKSLALDCYTESTALMLIKASVFPEDLNSKVLHMDAILTHMTH